MRLIHPKFEIIEQQAGLEGIYKQIELCGRVAYKSEDKITEDSARKFVEKLIAAKHLSPLEHGTVYLKAKTNYVNLHIHPEEGEEEAINPLDKYEWNCYSRINEGLESNYTYKYVITNYRVIIENNWFDDLKYLCKPTEYHEKRVTVRFTCDRGVSHEFVRHRVFSFAQESTRYCNYTIKDKFGNDVTYIIPNWCKLKEGYYGFQSIINNSISDKNINVGESYFYSENRISTEKDVKKCKFMNDEYTPFINSLSSDEVCYFSLINKGWKPQQARQVLPNALKTELIMTGFIEDWKHFFSLRSPEYGAKGVHPDAAYLADKVYTKFKDKKYL